MQFSILHNLTRAAYKVVVHKLFFHLALQEWSHCLLEVQIVFLVDEEIKFVTAIVAIVSIFLGVGESVPLFYKIENIEFSCFGAAKFPDFT